MHAISVELLPTADVHRITKYALRWERAIQNFKLLVASLFLIAVFTFRSDPLVLFAIGFAWGSIQIIFAHKLKRMKQMTEQMVLSNRTIDRLKNELTPSTVTRIERIRDQNPSKHVRVIDIKRMLDADRELKLFSVRYSMHKAQGSFLSFH